jgi:hypothetical protein
MHVLPEVPPALNNRQGEGTLNVSPSRSDHRVVEMVSRVELICVLTSRVLRSVARE